jgi:actin-related protein
MKKEQASKENENKEEIKMTKEEVLANLKKRASEEGGTNFLRFEEGEQRVLYIVSEDTEKFLSPVWVVKDLESGESLYLSQYGYLKSRFELGKAYFVEYEGESEIKQGKYKGKKARLFRVTELTKADLSAFDTDDIPF